MPGEPAEPSPAPEESEAIVLALQRQMARLKRWFAWELWLLEPRSFDPPDDPVEHESKPKN